MIKADGGVDLENLEYEVTDFLLQLECELGRELVITSGYRSKEHPVEVNKSKPGEHTLGLAVDIACLTPIDFYDLVHEAMKLGCERIGVSRKNKFVHLGFDIKRPKSLWTY